MKDYKIETVGVALSNNFSRRLSASALYGNIVNGDGVDFIYAKTCKIEIYCTLVHARYHKS